MTIRCHMPTCSFTQNFWGKTFLERTTVPTVQCYHSNCNIIENHSTHAILNASLKFSITALARVQAQVWLLRVTNNSLELTLTYEGLRVWPGQ